MRQSICPSWCKTKPRPGELLCDFRLRVAYEMLRRVGAPQSEASDFADILTLEPLFISFRPEAVRERWQEWRADKIRSAREVVQRRERLSAAGYLVNMDAPITLGCCETDWRKELERRPGDAE